MRAGRFGVRAFGFERPHRIPGTEIHTAAAAGVTDGVAECLNPTRCFLTTCLSRVLNSTMFESWDLVGPFPSWWLFNSLLLVLQVLHIIWFYLITRIALKALMRGKVSKDVRSDIESSSEEETAKTHSHVTSAKRENGTNGHFGSQPWTQNDSNG